MKKKRMPTYEHAEILLKAWRETFAELHAGEKVSWDWRNLYGLDDFRKKVFWPALDERINKKSAAMAAEGNRR